MCSLERLLNLCIFLFICSFVVIYPQSMDEGRRRATTECSQSVHERELVARCVQLN